MAPCSSAQPREPRSGCSRRLISGYERNWPNSRSISMKTRVDSLTWQKEKVSDSWVLTSAACAVCKGSGVAVLIGAERSESHFNLALVHEGCGIQADAEHVLAAIKRAIRARPIPRPRCPRAGRE